MDRAVDRPGVSFMALHTATELEQRHLMRAVDLGYQGRGQTSPNPMVGAVVARDGRTLGEGYHVAAGRLHAEREALAACSEDPRGATLYVSLEPCCHQGRTPPCTDAILEAGIARVVVGSDDPTPKASGRGLGILRDEGVEVVVAQGAPAAAARLLNQPFRKHARTGRPLVILKSAMTLDGKVATRSGDSQWITCDVSRALAHRFRAEVDAVAVGIGTALHDDPRLTARFDGVARQPRRVVFDSEARLPLGSHLVREAGGEVILVCSRAASRAQTDALEAAGVEIIVVSGQNEDDRVRSGLNELGAREIQSVLLEGGPHLAGSFFDADEIDQARTFIAPVMAGGREARVPIEGQGVESIDMARRALHSDVERIGEDVLITARFKEW